MAGLSIRLFLVDGTPTGTLTAEIINWTGRVLVANRDPLSRLAEREEARRTGLYFLTGADPENPTRDCVYVGESDNVLARLATHNSGKGAPGNGTTEEAEPTAAKLEFWTRTVVVTSKDENLTKAHARYLEARLIQLAKEAGRARITNRSSPAPPPLPESDRADMEYFLAQLQVLLPALGFIFLQPPPRVTERGPSNLAASPLFKIESVGVKAEARQLDGEFVVLKGSTARKQGTPSWDTYRELRDKLISDGKLVDGRADEVLVFAVDVPFESPSAAASVVRAGNTNGRKEWRESTSGKNYGEWQELQLQLAGVEPEER